MALSRACLGLLPPSCPQLRTRWRRLWGRAGRKWNLGSRSAGLCFSSARRSQGSEEGDEEGESRADDPGAQLSKKEKKKLKKQVGPGQCCQVGGLEWFCFD